MAYSESNRSTVSRPISQSAWTVRNPNQPARVISQPRARLSRRFEVEWLAEDDIQMLSRVAPALPVFEQAFGAFMHGVLIQTVDGPVAVEDLLPGTELETGDGRTTQLLWKGTITLVPGAPTLSDEPDRLYRVRADAFGPGKPTQDQTFGPHARRLNRDPKLRAMFGAESALMPLSEMADGDSVIAVNPVSPTRVYHLACEEHSTILAAGLEVETYHPGPDAPLSLSDEMMQLFMEFFPYLDHIRDFGRLAAPRISAADMGEAA